MDPKRLRLLIIAAAIPIGFVVLVSVFGGSGDGGGAGNAVVVKRPGTGGAVTGGATGGTTGGTGLTIADLMKAPPPATGGATPAQLPKADPAVVNDLMDRGERHYMSGDLAQARGHFSRAAQLDPACERCANKLQRLEAQMLNEIREAFRAGESYLNTSRYDQAIWSLERVLVLDPDVNSVHHLNARTKIEEAKRKKAERGR